MTVDEMVELFEAASENYSGIFVPDGRFGTKRTDLHVFLLLDSLLPPEPNSGGYISDVVSAAEHDQIWLVHDLEKLAAVITPELIVELDAAGVMVEEGCGLSMFA